VVVVDETESLVVKVGVTDRELALLDVGQAVSLQPEDASPPFKGVVSSLASTPSAADGLYSVEVQPEKRKLQPGTLIGIRFEEAKPDVTLRIPLEAMVRRQDKDWVFVVEGEKDQPVVRLRAIEPGRSEGKLVTVRSGLKNGERIVTEGAYFLQGDQPVRILDSEVAL
jgi:multidrug efflux pump subunit AcrA (membrane-fusion protein)